MDKRIVRGLISESSGVVALTPILAATYAPSKPCLIIDGFAEDGLVRSVESEERDRPLLVYAGGLDEKYGLRTLVEAVLVLRIDCELAVFGSGQLFDWVNRVSRESGRVRSPMSLPRDELLVEYGRADVLVQPRSVSQELVSVSFPSKLIEYIASERPVLSTRIPGISEELDPYLHWIEGDDLASMVAGLERCLHEPEPSRRRKAVLAREHIMATRGPERRGRQLVEFVESVSLGVELQSTGDSRP